MQPWTAPAPLPPNCASARPESLRIRLLFLLASHLPQLAQAAAQSRAGPFAALQARATWSWTLPVRCAGPTWKSARRLIQPPLSPDRSSGPQTGNQGAKFNRFRGQRRPFSSSTTLQKLHRQARHHRTASRLRYHFRVRVFFGPPPKLDHLAARPTRARVTRPRALPVQARWTRGNHRNIPSRGTAPRRLADHHSRRHLPRHRRSPRIRPAPRILLRPPVRTPMCTRASHPIRPPTIHLDNIPNTGPARSRPRPIPVTTAHPQ